SHLPVGLAEEAAGPLRAAAVGVDQIARQHYHAAVTERRLRGLDRLRILPGAVALGGGVEDVARDVIHDAQDRHAVDEQPDADGEYAQAGDEIVGSVDRIDHPDPPARIGAFKGDGVAGVGFLSHDAVAGEALAKPGDNEA